MSLTYSATSIGVAAGNLGKLPYGSGTVGGLQLGSRVDKAFDVSWGEQECWTERQLHWAGVVGLQGGRIACMAAAPGPLPRAVPRLPALLQVLNSLGAILFSFNISLIVSAKGAGSTKFGGWARFAVSHAGWLTNACTARPLG